MSVRQRKEELRQKMLRTLRAIPEEKRKRDSDQVATYLSAWISSFRDQIGSKGVAIFSSLSTEIDLSPLEQHLQTLGIRRFLPNWDEKHPDLWFYELTNNVPSGARDSDVYPQLSATHSFLEHLPLSEIAVLIVPALAFDRFGHRLGRGKGYYDRCLTSVRKLDHHVITTTVGYDLQLLEEIPIEQHDQHIDWICTPSRGVEKSH